MSFATDPYKLDSFWIERMKEVLSSPYISPSYRKRCEAIYIEADKKIAKKGIVDNHYPAIRK